MEKEINDLESDIVSYNEIIKKTENKIIELKKILKDEDVKKNSYNCSSCEYTYDVRIEPPKKCNECNSDTVCTKCWSMWGICKKCKNVPDIALKLLKKKIECIFEYSDDECDEYRCDYCRDCLHHKLEYNKLLHKIKKYINIFDK